MQAENKLIAELLQTGQLWPALNNAGQAGERGLSKDCSLGYMPPVGLEVNNSIVDPIVKWGLESGKVHEWLASAVPTSIFALLTAHALHQAGSSKFVIWIGKSVWPTPHLLERCMHTSMSGSKFDLATNAKYQTEQVSLLSNCIFLAPQNYKLYIWSLLTALRCPAVAAVVAQLDSIPLILGRRLSLAARAGGGLGLIYRNQKYLTAPNTLSSRWQVSPLVSNSTHPNFFVELRHCKGQQPTQRQWAIQLQEEAYAAGPPTLSLHLLPQVEHQSHQARSACL